MCFIFGILMFTSLIFKRLFPSLQFSKHVYMNYPPTFLIVQACTVLFLVLFTRKTLSDAFLLLKDLLSFLVGATKIAGHVWVMG